MRHPQIAQRKQRTQFRRVLGQASVAHFHMAELAFDHAKRMLDQGADTRLGSPPPAVLGRTGRCNQRGIDGCAQVEAQVLLLHAHVVSRLRLHP